MRWIIYLLMSVGLAVFADSIQGQEVTIPNGTIAFLGDSITSGYGLDPAQAYPALINIKGMTTLNMGVYGSKTDDALQRLKDYFSKGGKPNLVVIALGANDMLQGVPLTVMETNLDNIVLECKNHGVPDIICGIQIPGISGSNEIFEKVAQDGHVPLIRDFMQGQQLSPSLIQADGLHPNAEGQKVIAAKIQNALLKSFTFGSPEQK